MTELKTIKYRGYLIFEVKDFESYDKMLKDQHMIAISRVSQPEDIICFVDDLEEGQKVVDDIIYQDDFVNGLDDSSDILYLYHQTDLYGDKWWEV